MLTDPSCTQSPAFPWHVPLRLFIKFSEQWSLPSSVMHLVLGGDVQRITAFDANDALYIDIYINITFTSASAYAKAVTLQ